MAGFSKIYCIGGLGGFNGADGVNPLLFQILVGVSDRQWLQSHYMDASIKPIGKIDTVIPAKPDDPDALLDACIAFFPSHFQICPALAQVSVALKDANRLDFNSRASEIPIDWDVLRGQAGPSFRALNIWYADLKPLTL